MKTFDSNIIKHIQPHTKVRNEESRTSASIDSNSVCGTYGGKMGADRNVSEQADSGLDWVLEMKRHVMFPPSYF